MGAAYTIMGKSVAPHLLALGTIGTVLLFTAVPNPFAAKKVLGEPTIGAALPEEEKFVVDYLAKHLKTH